MTTEPTTPDHAEPVDIAAQTAAEQDAEEADYRRYRAELLRRAIEMPPHKVAELIERAERLARERDDYRAALELIGTPIKPPGGGSNLTAAGMRECARRALEPPF